MTIDPLISRLLHSPPNRTKVRLIENSKKAIKILASNGIVTAYFEVSMLTGDCYCECGSSPQLTRKLKMIANKANAKSFTLPKLQKILRLSVEQAPKKVVNRGVKVTKLFKEMQNAFS